MTCNQITIDNCKYFPCEILEWICYDKKGLYLYYVKNEIYSISVLKLQEDILFPISINFKYYSLIENRFYNVSEFTIHAGISIDTNNEQFDSQSIPDIQFRFYPYGYVVFYLSWIDKSMIANIYKADPWMHNEDISIASIPFNYFKKNIVRLMDVDSEIPSNLIVDKFLRCYNYRFLIIYYDADILAFNSKYQVLTSSMIQCILYDATYDKRKNGELFKYHMAGKPKKLAVKWYVKKSEYATYFWFEAEKICEVFDRFYGAHPDTKTDFIIRIDAEKKKYELALYRYGLKEPQIIVEDVYQLIVFKNKFEDYRSDNYNQERGAWIW